MTRKLVVITAGVLAVGGLSTGIAVAAGAGGGDEAPLTGSALERASAAALAHTGGGTVLETEAGDDGAAYGVEIRLEDGSVVEVSLDESFQVVDNQVDDDGPGYDDEGNGD